MSPLQIRIMLHYSYSAAGWEEESFAAKSAIGDFCRSGMFSSKAGPPAVYCLTDKGKAYVEKLCSIPIPTEQITYSFAVEE